MVDLNGIQLKNRFVVAAGGLGYGLGYPWEQPLIKLGLIDPTVFGAVTTKTLTNEPRTGNYIDPLEFGQRSLMSHLCRIFSSERKRVLRKVPGGWINDMGWWNAGIDYWVEEIYPHLKNVAIVPSIGGFVTDHYTELIQRLNPLDIVAIELNISCPNVENPLSKNSSELVKLFAACREASRHPLIVKLGADCDYIQAARIAEYCRMNAISAINAIPVLGGPLQRGEARSTLLSGGYSGPAIKPIALKAVADIRKNTNLPIIGGGGIYSWEDCQEFFGVGADAVSFGSVHILQPWKSTQIIKKHEGQT